MKLGYLLIVFTVTVAAVILLVVSKPVFASDAM